VRRPQALRQFPACYLAGAAATGAEELLDVPVSPPPPLDDGVLLLGDAELEPESEPELEPESEPPLEPSFLVEL
jgi:hypothetical protein